MSSSSFSPYVPLSAVNRKIMSKTKGFSVIELVVVLVIIAVLALIAVALYSTYVRQSRRADGVNTLLAMSLAQERYRTVNINYGTLAQVWNSVTTSPQGFYTLAITDQSATGYTMTATGIGDQAKDIANGTSCSPLTLTATNGTVSATPTACWPQ
jgi:type IV pilus assembly protein PilE